MKRFVLAVLLSHSVVAAAQTPEERKTIDAWLLAVGDVGPKEAAAVKLIEGKPALAKSRELLVAGLDNSGIQGDLGPRGRKLAELLLSKGADPNAVDKEGTPLLIKYGMFARVVPMEILLSKGANPNATDPDKRTALHWLATMGELEKDEATLDAVRAAGTLLLDKKADVNAKDKRGTTPLHLAAHNGAKAFVELLLARGAELNAVDNDGYSPLGSALLRIGDKKGQPTFANDREKAATRTVVELLQAKGAKDLRPK